MRIFLCHVALSIMKVIHDRSDSQLQTRSASFPNARAQIWLARISFWDTRGILICRLLQLPLLARLSMATIVVSIAQLRLALEPWPALQLNPVTEGARDNLNFS